MHAKQLILSKVVRSNEVIGIEDHLFVYSLIPVNSALPMVCSFFTMDCFNTLSLIPQSSNHERKYSSAESTTDSIETSTAAVTQMV